MKKILIPAIVIACMLMAGSAMSMARRGPGVDVVVSIPVLPTTVELRDEPYYYHSGYYYHYDNDRWYYARSKRGPWADLPRDHYPRETRYRGRSWRHDHGRDHRDNRHRGDWGHDQGYDGRYDDRDHDGRYDNRDHDGRR